MAEFATLTHEQLRDGYLRDLRIAIPGARTEDGSHEWVRATALANMCLLLLANGLWASKQALPDTADETGLARFARVYSVPKLGAQKAKGSITISGSFATSVADGATLQNLATGARYEIVGATALDPVTFSATAFVIALDPGRGGNAAAGTVIAFEGPPPGIDTNATVLSISGGDEAWTDARWAVEILKRMRQAPLAGNIAHILALAHCIGGVEQAFVFPALRGAGTLDVVVLTSAASGTRIAGTDVLAQVLGAIQVGATAPGGAFIGGICEDAFRNTKVHAVVEQATDLRIDYKASAANAWEAWPPHGVGYVVPGTEATWYKVTGSPTSNVAFNIAKPASGTVVAPTVGDLIGAFFALHGYCKTKLTGVVDAGAHWSVTTEAWQDSNQAAPTSSIAAGVLILPWNAQLTNIAGAPLSSDSKALSGAIPEYFAALGPGEMTPLTADDVTRRRRWPRTSDTNPVSGEVEYPTDVTSRLPSAVLRRTDAIDVTHSIVGGTTATPEVPAGAFIGTPPRLLVLRNLYVIPTV